MDLPDIYRIFYPTAPTSAKYTFFLAAYGTFSKVDPNTRKMK
jgi:hypothetical protein